MCRILIIYIVLLIAIVSTTAQPTICEAPFEMTPFCNDACIICDIDGFQGRHDSNIRGEAPSDFCVFGVENAQWIAFLAGSETLIVDVAVSNCDNFFLFSGLQMAIYESLDCETFTRKSNCIGGVFQIREGFTGRLTMDDLTVGQYYYLVMDGAAGDNCDWTMTVQSGTTAVAPLDSTGVILLEEVYCSNDTVQLDIDPEVGATEFVWQINQDTVATVQQWDTLLSVGVYEVCVTGSNACNVGPVVCDTIEVLPLLSDTVTVEICESSCTAIGDSVICDQGIYDILVAGSSVGCDTLRRAIVQLVPDLQLTVDTTICQGSCVEVFDTTICELGLFLLTRQGDSGACDSSIVIQVREADNIRIERSFDICESSCASISDTVLCVAGVWQFERLATIGCDTTYEVTIAIRDTSFRQIDTLVCPGSLFTIDGIDLEPPTIYTQIRQGVNNCDSTIRWTIEELPGDTITETYNLCEGDTLLLDGTVILDGGLYITRRAATPCSLSVISQVQLLAFTTSSITATVCAGDTLSIAGETIVTAGTYTASLQDINGCDSMVVIEVGEGLIDTVMPDIDYYCQGDSIQIGGLAVVQDTAIYVVIPRPGSCDSVVQRRLDFVDCRLGLGRNIFPIDCRGRETASIDFAFFNGIGPYTLMGTRDGTAFLNEIFDVDTGFSIDGLVPGLYQFVLTDRLGNLDFTAITISLPLEVELSIELSDYLGYEVSCLDAADGSIAVAVEQANGVAQVALNDQPYVGELSDLRPGVYRVAVIDELGCTVDTSVTLASPDPPEIDLFVEDLACSSDTAAIIVYSIWSAVQLPVVSVDVNGETPSVTGVWSVAQDMQGLQMFSVTDANGCVGIDSVVIDVPSPSVFDVVDTVYVTQGDSITILLEWEDAIATVLWSGDGLSCTTCLMPTVLLPGTHLVSVDITDRMGCVSTQVITIIVEERPDIVLPNIFSPNGDGVNDEWIITHPSIAQVLEVAIYDRWGNQVYSQLPQGQSEQVQWEGLYRGETVTAGVYVYQLEIVSAVTGQREVRTGTLTVIR